MFASTGKDGVTPGPLVVEAIATLVDDDERQGQEDITVIGEPKVDVLLHKIFSLTSPRRHQRQ